MAVPSFDIHFLYLGPGLSADWLFTAARRYWLRFGPIWIADLDLAALVPARRKIAITSLARRDTAKTVRDQIARFYPRAYHDPLVYDFMNEMQLTLDGRAEFNQRFGVPET
jgi:hypothetical protein